MTREKIRTEALAPTQRILETEMAIFCDVVPGMESVMKAALAAAYEAGRRAPRSSVTGRYRNERSA